MDPMHSGTSATACSISSALAANGVGNLNSVAMRLHHKRLHSETKRVSA